MPSISKKQALICAESLLVNFRNADDRVDVCRMLIRFTEHPIVLAAFAVKVADAFGGFPDIYDALLTVDKNFATSYAAAVYQFDQRRKQHGEPSLPIQFDGAGASNVVYIADWKARRAAA